MVKATEVYKMFNVWLDEPMCGSDKETRRDFIKTLPADEDDLLWAWASGYLYRDNQKGSKSG